MSDQLYVTEDYEDAYYRLIIALEVATLERDGLRWELREEHKSLERAEYAMAYIRTHLGHVCHNFQLCKHPACQDSYGAWALADAYAHGWELPHAQVDPLPGVRVAHALPTQEHDEHWCPFGKFCAGRGG